MQNVKQDERTAQLGFNGHKCRMFLVSAVNSVGVFCSICSCVSKRKCAICLQQTIIMHLPDTQDLHQNRCYPSGDTNRSNSAADSRACSTCYCICSALEFSYTESKRPSQNRKRLSGSLTSYLDSCDTITNQSHPHETNGRTHT